MKKTVRLQIAVPCHEDWDRMSLSSQGRFCEQCTKEVVDFSWMTDAQILRVMNEMKGQSVCGNFRSSQLDRPIQVQAIEEYSGTLNLRAVLVGAALTTLVSLSSCAQTEEIKTLGEVTQQEQPASSACSSQTELRGDTLVVSQERTRGDAQLSYDHRGELFTAGMVINDRSHLMKHATVFVIGANGEELTHVETDESGQFSLSLDWSRNPTGLRIVKSGYSARYVNFSTMNKLTDLRIRLDEYIQLKGKVIREE